MLNFFGGRGASVAAGLLTLAFGSTEAAGQSAAMKLDVASAVRSLDVNTAAQPLGLAAANSVSATLPSASVATAIPAASVSASLASSIQREASWLYSGGWPLYALVDKYSSGAALSEEANCVATAVYFEARGESLEGQLAVARVIMNRAASGQYPASWCGVVKQPAQFSFVRRGVMPQPRYESDAWKKAQGVTRIAMANVVPSLTNDVLWYHADYVDPSWGHRLSMAQKIGQHIFYR